MQITVSKQRLEAFSDGVIAIVITIMVLGIQLPASFEWPEIWAFLKDIFVFFVSFVVVAMFWNRHRRWFEFLESVNEKLIWRNLLFLFVLAIIPLFTKWIMQYPGQTIPVAGYGLVCLLANLSFQFLFAGALPLCKEDVRKIIAQRKQKHLLGILMMAGGILLIAIGAFFFPQISTWLLMLYPMIAMLLNLWFEQQGPPNINNNACKERNMEMLK